MGECGIRAAASRRGVAKRSPTVSEFTCCYATSSRVRRACVRGYVDAFPPHRYRPWHSRCGSQRNRRYGISHGIARAGACIVAQCCLFPRFARQYIYNEVEGIHCGQNNDFLKLIFEIFGNLFEKYSYLSFTLNKFQSKLKYGDFWKYCSLGKIILRL